MKKSLERFRWKNKMLNTLITGNIYNDVKYRDGETVRHLPKIKEINVSKNIVEYVLECHSGINPTLVSEKKWLLEQEIGAVLDMSIHKSKFIIIKIEK